MILVDDLWQNQLKFEAPTFKNHLFGQFAGAELTRSAAKNQDGQEDGDCHLDVYPLVN